MIPVAAGLCRELSSLLSGGIHLRSKLMLSVVLALASMAYAKQPKIYQTGKLVKRTTYHIRPRDEKHPALLPVGEQAQFRLERDKMLLRAGSGDDKEHEYTVVSMTPRSDASAADSTPAQANHLQ